MIEINTIPNQPCNSCGEYPATHEIDFYGYEPVQYWCEDCYNKAGDAQFSGSHYDGPSVQEQYEKSFQDKYGPHGTHKR